MSAVDFGEWADVDGLVLTLGGRTYTVPSPSVRDMGLILAAAVRAEVRLGLVKGEVPAEVAERLASLRPDEHPSLGPVWAQLEADGVAQVVADRVAYYATFYWARGKSYADALAQLLWGATAASADAGDGGPKGS